MKNVSLQQETESLPMPTSYINDLFDRCEQILSQHRFEEPNLYRIVEERKVILLKKADEQKSVTPPTTTSPVADKVSESKPLDSSSDAPILLSLHFTQSVMINPNYFITLKSKWY